MEVVPYNHTLNLHAVKVIGIVSRIRTNFLSRLIVRILKINYENRMYRKCGLGIRYKRL